MRKIFIAVALLSLGSCLNESVSSPSEESTFVRYFNGGNNDAAQAMEVTPDGGFIILATTTVKKTDADKPKNKIKLIKTDKFGNQVWQSIIPAATDTAKNYTASSLQLLPDGGYVITGDDIQTNGTTKTLLLTVNPAGELARAASFSTLSSGKAVAINISNNFLVLSTSGTDSMRLSEVNKNDFTVSWTKIYAAGSTSLARRLFVEDKLPTNPNPQKVLWAGVVTKSGLTGIRMVKATENANNTDFDLLISKPGFSETSTDFCRFGIGDGYSYAITGSTNQKSGSAAAGSDTDILFKRMTADGTVLSTNSFPFETDNQNDVGNSISPTSDGGVVLLSSVGSAAISGRGDTDYYLLRLDPFGNKVWSSAFGSRFKDEGVTVRQTLDGGYAVLGTTTQGNLKIISLTKTNKEGKIE